MAGAEGSRGLAPLWFAATCLSGCFLRGNEIMHKVGCLLYYAHPWNRHRVNVRWRRTTLVSTSESLVEEGTFVSLQVRILYPLRKPEGCGILLGRLQSFWLVHFALEDICSGSIEKVMAEASLLVFCRVEDEATGSFPDFFVAEHWPRPSHQFGPCCGCFRICYFFAVSFWFVFKHIQHNFKCNALTRAFSRASAVFAYLPRADLCCMSTSLLH